MDEETPKAELTIKKANTKDGNVGWDIRLQRLMRPAEVQYVAATSGATSKAVVIPEHLETDEEYFQRAVEMYDRCWKQWGKENANG